MIQNTEIDQIQQWLPEIDPCSIETVDTSVEEKNHYKINQISENIFNWAKDVLKNAKLPTTYDDAKSLIKKYDAASNEGCAFQIVKEYEALQNSIENNDASTASIAAMKMFDTIWQRAISKSNTPSNKSSITEPEPEESINDSSIQIGHEETDADIQLYQDTINELKTKYPHCTVNALRLLVATRLNVSKQQLDELDISPE